MRHDSAQYHARDSHPAAGLLRDLGRRRGMDAAANAGQSIAGQSCRGSTGAGGGLFDHSQRHSGVLSPVAAAAGVGNGYVFDFQSARFRIFAAIPPAPEPDIRLASGRRRRSVFAVMRNSFPAAILWKPAAWDIQPADAVRSVCRDHRNLGAVSGEASRKQALAVAGGGLVWRRPPPCCPDRAARWRG